MIKTVALQVLKTLVTSLFSERFVINLLVLLGEWAVKRWGNDLMGDLFEQFKDSLDRDHGQPMNLYAEVKKRA